MRVASFFPFQTTYYLNGHSFIEAGAQAGADRLPQETTTPSSPSTTWRRCRPAADRLSPAIIRGRLDYWTLILGPKFSTKERKQLNLSRFYAIARSSIAATSSSSATFPSTNCSSAAASSAYGA